MGSATSTAAWMNFTSLGYDMTKLEQTLLQGREQPLKLAKLLWPHVEFYRQQREIIESVVHNDETFVPAGNMLGKDFVAGYVALWFFLTRVPCRVVTTSADHTQLEGVLWGEIRRFIQSSTIPLEHDKGGPLHVTHLRLKRVYKGQIEPLSYCIGRVAAKGEGMLGHHIPQTGDGIPRTLAICDEASGVEDVSYERMQTWCSRFLAIGNPYPGAPGCTFFQKYCQLGDVVAGDK
jgi:hypothetical protein